MMISDGSMSFLTGPADDEDEWDDSLEDELPGVDLFSDTSDIGEHPLPARRVSLPIAKPQYRHECIEGPRPCPWVSCRYHLYLDVTDNGALRINFPDREPWDMGASCALDLASDGPRTLDLIGGLMGVSKERARQLERTGTNKFRAKVRKSDVID